MCLIRLQKLAMPATGRRTIRSSVFLYKQINNLVERKGMVIADHEFAVSKLKDISCFSLIDGYKNLFYNPMTRKYREGTDSIHEGSYFI